MYRLLSIRRITSEMDRFSFRTKTASSPYSPQEIEVGSSNPSISELAISTTNAIRCPATEPTRLGGRLGKKRPETKGIPTAVHRTHAFLGVFRIFVRFWE